MADKKGRKSLVFILWRAGFRSTEFFASPGGLGSILEA
jgi:hypothetical protein